MKMKEIVAGDFLRESDLMEPEEVKVKVYGLMLTRRRYIVIQVVCFIWMLALYGLWRMAHIQASPNIFARNFDLFILAVYLYGMAETAVVLRKFKKLGGATGKADPKV